MLEDETHLDDIPSDDDEFDGEEEVEEEAAAEPEPEPEPEPEADDEEDDTAPTQEEAYNAFLAKHKDKPQEELIRLAYQQNQARAQARGKLKDANAERAAQQRTFDELAESLRARREERAAQLEEQRAAFEDQLIEDPDAAARVLHNRQLEEQERRQQEWEMAQLRDQQTQLAQQAIPNFEEAAPRIIDYAVQRHGFHPQEIQNIADHRHLVILDKARLYDEMMANGGHNPQLRTENERTLQRAASAKPTARNIGGARGSNSSSKSLVARAQEIADMSDEDFDNLSDADFARTMKAIGQAR
jgi:hypothetical protein